MKLKFVVGVLLIMAAAMCICACGSGDDVGLSDKERSEIVSAYAKKYKTDEQDVSFTCYGKFNKAYVLIFDEKAEDGETEVTVETVRFYFKDSRQFKVYYSGKFYDINTAYSDGMITYDNLISVQKKHAEQFAEVYNNHIVILTDKEHSTIASAIAKKWNWIKKSEVRLACYGKFNGAYVFINSGGTSYLDVLSSLTVDGVQFYFPTANQFKVYKDGEIYDLQEAFDNGFVTHDDLRVLQAHWE